MTIDIPPKFVDLWTASTRVGAEVSVIGVVSDSLPARKTSGTDWTCTFSIADRSYGFIGEVGQEGLKARFFKKMESELPRIWGIGDVVILRNMKIKQFNGVTLAMASYSSTWTVFHAPAIPDKIPANLVQIPHDRETRAPAPTPSEMQYVVDVCSNFDKTSYTSKEAPIAVSPGQTEKVALAASMATRQKFSLIKDLHIATYYDLVGQVVKIYPSNGRTDLYITDYTPNQLLYFYEWGQGEDGLEGRDGDEFGYTSRSSKNTKKWPGPFGKLTLAVTLWSPHSEHAQMQVKEGYFVFLRNTHIRLDQDTKMVGSLHSDRRHPDRIDISVLTDFHDDDRVKDVLRRKKDYHKKFDQQSEKYLIEAKETKDTESTEVNKTEKKDVKPLSRNQIRKMRKQNRKVHPAQSIPTDKVSTKRKRSEDAENEPPPSSGEISTHYNRASASPPLKASKRNSRSTLNENVKCSHHLTRTSPLSTILSLDAHVNKTPKGTIYTLPFQNINSRALVRVIDFWPSRLENFAVPKRKRSEYAVLSDYEESDSEIESHKKLPGSHDAKRTEAAQGDFAATERGESDGEEQGWEWRFALLLEDASEHGSSPESTVTTLKAYIYGSDAECLLKLDAEDLRASPTALAALREKLFLLWGNLEERKMKIDEMEKGALKEIGRNEQKADRKKQVEVKARPFQCCLKEYGVKIKREDDETEETDERGDNGKICGEQDGSSWQWERRWRMWGCTII